MTSQQDWSSITRHDVGASADTSAKTTTATMARVLASVSNMDRIRAAFHKARGTMLPIPIIMCRASREQFQKLLVAVVSCWRNLDSIPVVDEARLDQFVESWMLARVNAVPQVSSSQIKEEEEEATKERGVIPVKIEEDQEEEDEGDQEEQTHQVARLHLLADASSTTQTYDSSSSSSASSPCPSVSSPSSPPLRPTNSKRHRVVPRSILNNDMMQHAFDGKLQLPSLVAGRSPGVLHLKLFANPAHLEQFRQHENGGMDGSHGTSSLTDESMGEELILPARRRRVLVHVTSFVTSFFQIKSNHNRVVNKVPSCHVFKLSKSTYLTIRGLEEACRVCQSLRSDQEGVERVTSNVLPLLRLWESGVDVPALTMVFTTEVVTRTSAPTGTKTAKTTTTLTTTNTTIPNVALKLEATSESCEHQAKRAKWSDVNSPD